MHSWLTASPQRFVTDVPGSHRSRPDLPSLKAPQYLAPPRRHDSSLSGAFVRVEMATYRHLIRQHGCRGGWRRDRYGRLHAQMPRTARDSQQAQGPEVAGRRERRSPEPRAPHFGGALGEKGVRRNRKARGERMPERPGRGRDREAARPRTACGKRSGPKARRSMPAGRAKEVSIGTNWTSSEGGGSRPLGQQRPRSPTLASSPHHAVVRALPRPRPRHREADVVRTWCASSQRPCMRRHREARDWIAMVHGHRPRRSKERGPDERLTGANEGTTRHPDAPPVANSGAHPLADPSSSGASALVRAARPRYGVAG
jgi:hypothetical protein